MHATRVVRHLPAGGPPDPEVARRVHEHLSRLLDAPPAVVLTSSCSGALEAAAGCLDLQPGDEVVVPAFTFPTTVVPFVVRGASVRFAEVDPRTGNVDAADVLAKIGPRTRAVVVMHYAGVGAALEVIVPALAGGDVSLVEDAACGIFGAIDGVPLGRTGRFGALSFHHTKNVSAVDGGALIVNDPADLDAVNVGVDKGTNRVQFDRGLTAAYEWSGPGSALRLPEVSLHYLAAELERADDMQARRQAAWSRYAAELPGWADGAGVGLPWVPPGRSHPAHIFHLVLPEAAQRPGFVARCAEGGVQVVRHYGSLPASAFGRTIARADDACPAAADLSDRLVRLPMHHELDDADVDRVLEVVTGALAR
ncbi:MAG: TDP-4-keto-6-deoxy-D-glucose transaminase [Acidimicrobiales bacterium]|nr:TDP-4-keto-6-deoxy-D-glucose transaminase [Acidimicrobiales bacterium]